MAIAEGAVVLDTALELAGSDDLTREELYDSSELIDLTELKR